jgi:hypothetical protein
MFLLRKEALVNSELSEFNKMLNLSDIDLGNVEPYKPIKGIKYNDESEEMNVYKATEKGSLKVIKTNANEITNR